MSQSIRGHQLGKLLGEMEEMLFHGMSIHQAEEDIAKRYQLTKRMVQRLLPELYLDWQKCGELSSGPTSSMSPSRAMSLGKAIRRREILFKDAMAKGDLTLALRIEQDRCRIEAIYPEMNTSETPTVVTPFLESSDDELEQIIRQSRIENPSSAGAA